MLTFSGTDRQSAPSSIQDPTIEHRPYLSIRMPYLPCLSLQGQSDSARARTISRCGHAALPPARSLGKADVKSTTLPFQLVPSPIIPSRQHCLLYRTITRGPWLWITTGHMWSQLPYGHTWSHVVTTVHNFHMVPTGHTWSHMVTSGHTYHSWSYKVTPVTSGHIWSLLVTTVPSGHTWSHLVTPSHTCDIWSHLVTPGHNCTIWSHL